MKFTTLLKCAEKRSTIPALTMVHIKNNIATTTDLNVIVKIAIEADNGVYNPHGFSNPAMRMQEPMKAPKDLPFNFQLGEEIDTCLVTQEQLEFVARAMSTEETRYYLNCIAFDGINMVATDGHRLHRVQLSKGLNGFKYTPIIPRKTVNLILSAMKETKQKDAAITLYEKHVKIIVGDYSIWSKLVYGRYPEYNRVIPDIEGRQQTLINIGELALHLKTIRILAKQQGTRFLSCEFNGNKMTFGKRSFDLTMTKFNHAIGFNVPYLVDTLDGVLHYGASTDPIMIQNAQKKMMAVVMPVRV